MTSALPMVGLRMSRNGGLLYPQHRAAQVEIRAERARSRIDGNSRRRKSGEITMRHSIANPQDRGLADRRDSRFLLQVTRSR